VTSIRLEPNISAQYLENGWRCYLATIAATQLLLLGSTVGYRSDSLASCLLFTLACNPQQLNR